MKSEAIKMIHTYAIIGSVVYSPLKLKLLITKYQIKQGQALGKIANRITPEHHQQSSAPILKDTIFPLHILNKTLFSFFQPLPGLMRVPNNDHLFHVFILKKLADLFDCPATTAVVAFIEPQMPTRA